MGVYSFEFTLSVYLSLYLASFYYCSRSCLKHHSLPMCSFFSFITFFDCNYTATPYARLSSLIFFRARKLNITFVSNISISSYVYNHGVGNIPLYGVSLKKFFELFLINLDLKLGCIIFNLFLYYS